MTRSRVELREDAKQRPRKVMDRKPRQKVEGGETTGTAREKGQAQKGHGRCVICNVVDVVWRRDTVKPALSDHVWAKKEWSLKVVFE